MQKIDPVFTAYDRHREVENHQSDALALFAEM